MRHLRPPGLLENVKDIICGFLKLREIERNILPDTPPSPSYTLQHPPRHPQISPDTPNSPLTYPRHCHGSPRHSQASLTFNRHDLPLSFPPESSLTSQMSLRMSDECFGSVKAVPGGHGLCLGCLGVFFEFPGVFWGCWRVYPGFESHL